MDLDTAWRGRRALDWAVFGRDLSLVPVAVS